MKKKFVVALVAAMSLTIAGTGTVFAMDKVSTIASEKEHVHGDNCEWVVDKEAWDETVHHPAEYKTVHHPAEYDTIHHPAEYDTIHHPEEGHYEIRTICHNCGADITGHASEHLEQNFENGCLSYGDKEVWIVDKEAWDEQVLIKDAWDEQVLVKDAWDEQVLVKEAWDEIVHHPEEDTGYATENRKSRSRSQRTQIRSRNSRRTQIRSQSNRRIQIRSRNNRKIQM